MLALWASLAVPTRRGMSYKDVVKLEEVLVADAGLDREVVRKCQAVAERDRTTLAEVLVDKRVLTEEALAQIVARRVGSMVIDIDKGAVDPESVKLVPEDVARRYLMLAVSSDRSSMTLRVVFANPLDTEAIRKVRELTGLSAEPLVATVSEVRNAIEREFQRKTKISQRPLPPPLPGAAAGSREIPQEVTRKVSPSEVPHILGGDPELADSGTAPVYRLEQGATIEQRHEALLLALIEAGVMTRSDYVAALQRLLGKAST